MQREELNELLTKAKELLKNEVTKIAYETWIRDLDIESAENNNIVLLLVPFISLMAVCFLMANYGIAI